MPNRQATVVKKTCGQQLLAFVKKLIPILLLVMYTLLGAQLFRFIEEDKDKARIVAFESHMAELRSAAVQEIKEEASSCAMNQTALLKALSDQWNNSMAHAENTQEMWSFTSAIFYCFSLEATIGYGYVYPQTNTGRGLTMLYVLIGIPLMVASLSVVSTAMLRLVFKIYTRVKDLGQVLLLISLIIVGCCCGSCSCCQSSNVRAVPAWLIILLFFLYITIVTIVQLFNKAIDPFDYEHNQLAHRFLLTFYNMVISLTTIGLGDVPIDLDEAHHRGPFVAQFIPFLFVGLSVVTMVISVLQNKIEHIHTSAMDYMLGPKAVNAFDTEIHQNDDDGGGGWFSLEVPEEVADEEIQRDNSVSTETTSVDSMQKRRRRGGKRKRKIHSQDDFKF